MADPAEGSHEDQDCVVFLPYVQRFRANSSQACDGGCYVGLAPSIAES